MAKDLVCGMEINPETAKSKIDYKGQVYYFCAEQCKTEFERNPQKYLKKGNFIKRFIAWLGEGNEGKSLSCHKK